MPRYMCECDDARCSACAGECNKYAVGKVYRIDMDDGETFFRFCPECTGDALESGVFSTDPPLKGGSEDF